MNVKQTYVRWNEIELMSERVEKYFQNSNDANFEFLRTYVSGICSYFPMSDQNNRFDSDIYEFFAFYYSVLFQELVAENQSPNLKPINKIFRAMNTDLLQISQSIIANQEAGVQKLLDSKSTEYKELKEKIYIFTKTYKSEFDDLIFTSSLS